MKNGITTYEQAIANARGAGVMTGAQIEREHERGMNRRDLRCECGGKLIYRHTTGGRNCDRCGTLHRANGERV